MKKSVQTHQYSFTCLFELQPEGGYTVTCPALPGLVTEGDNLEEAEWMAQDAIKGYVESLQMDGLPIPEDETPPKTLKRRIHVKMQTV